MKQHDDEENILILRQKNLPYFSRQQLDHDSSLRQITTKQKHKDQRVEDRRMATDSLGDAKEK